MGFLQQVIEYRRYAEAYAANAANLPGWDASPLRIVATEIEHELAEEEIAEDAGSLHDHR